MFDNSVDGSITFADAKLFESEVRALSNMEQAVALIAIERILIKERLALANGPWLRSPGSGLWEFRIGGSYKAVVSRARLKSIPDVPNFKILIRVFCSFQSKNILLISCYDKKRHGGGKKQDEAIRRARQLRLHYLKDN